MTLSPSTAWAPRRGRWCLARVLDPRAHQCQGLQEQVHRSDVMLCTARITGRVAGNQAITAEEFGANLTGVMVLLAGGASLTPS